MNAETKVKANEKLAIWNALSRTDPKHTKPFSRAGGFKGTAIKPIWIVQMLTEHFGPCGEGWGMDEPRFEVVHGPGGEMLVYCTVKCWHTDRANTFFGVGGDKAVGKNKHGLFSDDEAFKKAFTDAVNNAFKFVGVGADIHMGLFDDSKYVQHVAAEYDERDAVDHEATQPNEPAPRTKLDGPHTSKTALRKAVIDIITKVRLASSEEELANIQKENIATIRQANKDWPALLTGDPNIEEDIGLKGAIQLRREQLAEEGIVKGLIDSMKRCETRPALQSWIEENGDMVDGLDDVDRRKFELAYELHESALLTVATANA